MRAHFEDGKSFWEKDCEGKKVYWLINYDNFEVNRDILPQYIEELQRIMKDTAEGAVRYGGALNQRTVSRFTTMKIHSPANIYESREEALEVIKELQAGARKTVR